jgi:hypothetical protein
LPSGCIAIRFPAGLIADYQLGTFLPRSSGTYTWRSNITIDQNSLLYHLTTPDEPGADAQSIASDFEDRLPQRPLDHRGPGYDMNTLGGFDIRKNDMPFPSNKMNATMVGGM